MAWRCSSSSNGGLIGNLVRANIIKSPRVADAMTAIDRELYTAEAAARFEDKDDGRHTDKDISQAAYSDSPINIGYDVTCSAPHMHAYALEALLPFVIPADNAVSGSQRTILDVGSGSGYLTACLSALAGPHARVVGIEHLRPLVTRSREAIERSSSGQDSASVGWISNGRIVIKEADGRLGSPEDAPFDAIHVGAAAPVLLSALIDQLKSPGRMFIPVGTTHQAIIQVDKDVNGRVTQTKVMDVRYVPLTDQPPNQKW